jgi:purine-binding chemotaxis protein CheW
MGAIVDEVYEVLKIGENEIEPPPDFGTGASSEFILGIGKVGDKVVLLLDADRVLSDGQAEMFSEAAGAGA